MQSLEFLGVKMQFSSALANQAERSESEPALSGLGPSVMPSDPAAPTIATDQPVVTETSAIEAPPQPGGRLLDVAGNWRNAEGATYEIRQEGDQVTIREISHIFVLPVETASCRGTLSGAGLTAACETYVGTTGEIQLAAAGAGMLMGEYRDYTTGARIVMQLSR